MAGSPARSFVRLIVRKYINGSRATKADQMKYKKKLNKKHQQTANKKQKHHKTMSKYTGRLLSFAFRFVLIDSIYSLYRWVSHGIKNLK